VAKPQSQPANLYQGPRYARSGLISVSRYESENFSPVYLTLTNPDHRPICQFCQYVQLCWGWLLVLTRPTFPPGPTPIHQEKKETTSRQQHQERTEQEGDRRAKIPPQDWTTKPTVTSESPTQREPWPKVHGTTIETRINKLHHRNCQQAVLR
jgi:hypothetical protein